MGQSTLGSTQLARTAEQQGQLSSPSSLPVNSYGLGGKTGNPIGAPSAAPVTPAVPPSFSGLPSPVPSVPTPPSSLPAVATRPPMQGMPTPPPNLNQLSSPINTTYEGDVLPAGMPPPSGGKMRPPPTNAAGQTPYMSPPETINIDISDDGGLASMGVPTTSLYPATPPPTRTKNPSLGTAPPPVQPTNQLPVNMQPNPMLPY